MTEQTQKIQSKISIADELVFIFPVWCGAAPAAMKNFIDANFTS
jgi:putative NADPH-quinone reductase